MCDYYEIFYQQGYHYLADALTLPEFEVLGKLFASRIGCHKKSILDFFLVVLP